MKILIVHPGTQHSTRLTSAIKDSGYDVKLLTTVYNKKGTLINFLSKLLPKKERARLKSRMSKDLTDDDIIVTNELRGLILLLLGRLDKSKKIYVKYKYWVANKVAKKANKIINKYHYDVVIVFDTYAYFVFKKINNKSVIKIIDYTAAYPLFAKKIYDEVILKYPVFQSSLKKERCVLWDKKYMKAISEEVFLADKIICASSYTAKTLNEYGVNNSIIYQIPYGYDSDKSTNSENKVSDNFKILYVGGINVMKGVANLIDAFQKIDNPNIILELIGNVQDKVRELINDDRIELKGFIPHELLDREYEDADLFVFPSLSDGFGFAPLEAMSHGKACIVTKESGISDIIEYGKDGFIVSANDVNDLKQKIEWCILNRSELKKMGTNAKEKAKIYSNNRYKENIATFLKELEK